MRETPPLAELAGLLNLTDCKCESGPTRSLISTLTDFISELVVFWRKIGYWIVLLVVVSEIPSAELAPAMTMLSEGKAGAAQTSRNDTTCQVNERKGAIAIVTPFAKDQKPALQKQTIARKEKEHMLHGFRQLRTNFTSRFVCRAYKFD